MKLSQHLLIALEKAATDSGFDIPQSNDDAWLGFASSQCPLRIWLSGEERRPIVALSQRNVTKELGSYGLSWRGRFPPGAAAALLVDDTSALYRLLRRAFQLARTLPDELLHVFETQTASLPRTTEAERLVVQRVGQNLFRGGLLEYWEGRCAISGLDVPELLRASHAKPWADCETDAERLDVFNGLLLAPQYDAAFDCGFITIEDDGRVSVSHFLVESARRLLDLDRQRHVVGLREQHGAYLAWHRARVFRSVDTQARASPIAPPGNG